MKNLISIKKTSLIIGLSLITLFTNAKAKSGSKFPDVEKTIKESIVFTTPVSNQKVEVLFTTNQTGNVNFVLAKTEDTNLKSKIEKQFEQLNFVNLKAEVVYSIILNFKSI